MQLQLEHEDRAIPLSDYINTLFYVCDKFYENYESICEPWVVCASRCPTLWKAYLKMCCLHQICYLFIALVCFNFIPNFKRYQITHSTLFLYAVDKQATVSSCNCNCDLCRNRVAAVQHEEGLTLMHSGTWAVEIGKQRRRRGTRIPSAVKQNGLCSKRCANIW